MKFNAEAPDLTSGTQLIWRGRLGGASHGPPCGSPRTCEAMGGSHESCTLQRWHGGRRLLDLIDPFSVDDGVGAPPPAGRRRRRPAGQRWPLSRRPSRADRPTNRRPAR
eukprot:scaffold154746_cov31-Tisochrysis_lutea.AAC.1